MILKYLSIWMYNLAISKHPNMRQVQWTKTDKFLRRGKINLKKKDFFIFTTIFGRENTETLF